ncbi:hypothetical protein I4U23_012149 [Adineta vaga]|nr:hypothetical protein I4U23_012149 [Adineta vaga]
MDKYTLLSLALLLTLFYKTNGSNTTPVPPQPSQYTASILYGGHSGIYYADGSIFKDRLNMKDDIITWVNNYRINIIYMITDEMCIILPPENERTPMLIFPNAHYNGTVTYNGTLCNKWTGNHYRFQVTNIISIFRFDID